MGGAMQWLIFGATGYTGSALLSVCLEQGHGVWAHVRPDLVKSTAVD